MVPKSTCFEQDYHSTKESLLRIMNFQSTDSHSSPLFRCNHILKLEKILTENILFINKSFDGLLPPIFKSQFTFCADLHSYHTVSYTADKIFKRSYRIDSYGKNSITLEPINSWNKTQQKFSNLSLKTFSQTRIKSLLFKNALEVEEVILNKQTNLL